MCPSFLTGNQHSLIQARVVNGLTDSSQCIEAPLAALTFFENWRTACSIS